MNWNTESLSGEMQGTVSLGREKRYGRHRIPGPAVVCRLRAPRVGLPQPVRQSGFSLIELMVVVAIMGILLAVVVPNYNSYKLRAGRSDGKAALLEIAAAQERIYFQRGQYSADLSDSWNVKDGDDFVSNEGFYTVSIAVPDGGQTFTVTATARNRQSGDDDCATLSVDETGRKGATADGDGDTSVCW